MPPPPYVYDPTGIQHFPIRSFRFACGQTHDIQLAYRSFNPTSTKGTVLIPTCFGGKINTTLNFIEAPPKTSGHNYAFLEGPTSALLASSDYASGGYRKNGVHLIQGLRAFYRAYAAWLTSAEWFRRELWREMGHKSLHGWLHPPMHSTSRECWDADDLLTLARMWQAGDIGSVHVSGDYREALKGITARALVMPCRTDQYFSVGDGEEEASLLPKGGFAPIESVWGHRAGGGGNKADVEWMDGRIRVFLGATE
ncbi:hypothetical protein P154DRAFT_576018 [Amniculicola lignicola CBS 123094]|uniref:Alpha/beta-hydrolase n=1 Tax=Amniculicola lignicola CBS 123094 TaxID=1392246 RepID=A0A6A5WG03_9PLEO|nr:hypothetical protein P154DRAFT_576018 [Amniculicola lignicola CBS 123094]